MFDQSSSNSARTEIYRELASIRLIDPHTHINPLRPASSTMADILGYHYYTELAHSAGLSKSRIEDASLSPKELVGRLVEGLGPIENTAQYHWLIEICKKFFGFEEDRLHSGNWEALYDRSESIMASAQWSHSVLEQSNVAAVFLTNDFDDDLEGFDSQTYIPCLRTDDLVFHIADPKVRGRLSGCTNIDLSGSLTSLRDSLQHRFDHFVNGGARACAISLPPSFSPQPVSDGRAQTALDAILRDGLSVDAAHRDALSRRIFWTLAELCDQYKLPFDLMIGVNRGVYPGGVHQGRDLFDSRVSLIQYRELFNAFPSVPFPISVLASVTNQELASYAWIFPNVITNGHWWYSNTPSTISHDLALRLEAVPQTKQIGYYSDAYKLEFVWPKFDMYRQVLAGVLADQFVRDRGWSIERAVDLGRRVLRDNVEAIFPTPPSAERAFVADETETADVHEASDVMPAIAMAAAASSVLATAKDVDFDPATNIAEDFSADDDLDGNFDTDLGDITIIEDANMKTMEETGVHDVFQTQVHEEPDSPRNSTSIADPKSVAVPSLSADLLGMNEESGLEIENEIPASMSVDDFDSLDDLSAAEIDNEGRDSINMVEDEHPSEATIMEEHESLTVVDKREELKAEFDAAATMLMDDDVSLSDLPTIMEDPLPRDEEVGELGLMDVELIDFVDDVTLDPDQIDPEPLDAGDLMDDSEPIPKIEQLTGEGTFSPDELSLQLRSDPQTGEYTFPVEVSDDDGEFDVLTFDDDENAS